MTPRLPARRLAVAVAVAVAVASLALAGCAPSDRAVETSATAARSDVAQPALPVTVASADGRQVTVTDISRIVPLRGNISEVVFDLGLGDHVVGRDTSATFAESQDLPLVTRAHDVTAESVLSLRPTVVLADTDTGPPEALEQIRNVGVPVVVFEPPTSVAHIGERIEAIAAALGVASTGRALAAATTAEIDAVADEFTGGDPDRRLRVAFLYLRGQAAVYLIGGPGSGADSMIEAAGGTDAGTAMGLEQAFTPLTAEAMAAAAPDVLLLTTTGLASVGGVDGLVRIPGIAQTPAGRDRRVATVEDGLLYSFGTRTADALRDLARQLHAGSAGSAAP